MFGLAVRPGAGGDEADDRRAHPVSSDDLRAPARRAGPGMAATARLDCRIAYV